MRGSLSLFLRNILSQRAYSLREKCQVASKIFLRVIKKPIAGLMRQLLYSVTIADARLME
jgi:hypothetical protein